MKQSRAIFRILWFRWPWLLDPLQPLGAFTFVQPPEVQELTVTLQGGIKLMDTAFQWETGTLIPTFIGWNTATEQQDSVYPLLFWWPGHAYFVFLSVINYIFSVYSRALLNNSTHLTFFFIHSRPFCLKRWISYCVDVFMYRIFNVRSEVFLTLGDNVWQKNICNYVFINACLL